LLPCLGLSGQIETEQLQWPRRNVRAYEKQTALLELETAIDTATRSLSGNGDKFRVRGPA